MTTVLLAYCTMKNFVYQHERMFGNMHVRRKGEPNLTSKMFADWIHREYDTKIQDRTARRWLAKLGFSQVQHKKGVYFDRHERDDVVACRDIFLTKMVDLDKKSLTVNGNTPELSTGEKPLIRVVHDGCTYLLCQQQSAFFWGDGLTNVLRSKSLGASIMVSDFVDEVSGYVRDEQGQARLLLETNRDGYFTNDHLMAQVARTIDIFERVHPSATGLFLFDNAPSHHKIHDNALNADI